MSKERYKSHTSKIEKEEISMMANTAMKMDNTVFNQFLKANKAKINSIAPKNPSISKNDEWRKEDFWDEDYEEKDNR